MNARLLAALAILSSVALGVAVGLPVGERRAETRRPVGPPMTMLSENTLLNALSLSPTEERQVSAILRQGRQRTDSLMRTLLRQVLETTEGTRAALDRMLSPTQRSELDSLLRTERPGPQRRPAP